MALVQEEKKEWDVVIIGGGPIGLSAAKLAVDKGLKTIVLEKGNTCGFEVRAETVSPDPIITKIWDSDFLDDNLIISFQNKVVIHSPENRKQDEVVMVESPHSYHWRSMIDKMHTILKSYSNLEIKCNTAVSGIIKSNGSFVHGVETNNGIIYGKTILDCSGHNTVIGRLKEFNIDYNKVVDPIIKARYSNYDYKSDKKFHFFFIMADSILPHTPPCIVVLFPCANGEVEVGCQFFNDYGANGRVSSKSPRYTDKLLIEYYEKIKENAPGIKDKMKDLKKDFEFLTGMPEKMLLNNSMVFPGVALCGDAGAFMDPATNSGMISGMYSVNYWVNAAAEIVADGVQWNRIRMNTCNFKLKQEKFYTKLQLSHVRIGMSKGMMYEIKKTPDAVNGCWNFVIDMYNINNKESAIGVNVNNYGNISWFEQVSVIKGIVSGKIVLQFAESRILKLLALSKSKLSKEQWDMFSIELVDSYREFFKKFQGKKDLDALFDILGIEAKIQCVIFRGNKLFALQYVDDVLIMSASVRDCINIIKIFFYNLPIGLLGQNKVEEALNVVKRTKSADEFNELVVGLDGKKEILRFFNFKVVRERVEKLLEGIAS